MEGITIYLNSSVADIAATTPCYKLGELNRFAIKKVVEIVFKNDYCYISAKRTHKIKVPKKITCSSEELLKWIENKILTAWK